jgi:ABC-type sugar transport system ATPase subunit
MAATPDEILQFDRISRSFFGVQALVDVSFVLRAHRVLGLVGENGAGKTTLMNILGGVLKADRGAMRLRGRAYAPRNPAEATDAGVAFIHQELNLFTNLSIADNVFIDRFPRLGRTPFVDGFKARRHTRRALDALGLALSPRMLVERLTPGERQLVEIAKALNTGAEVFILDEPTTSLTVSETERLFGIIENLKAQGKSAIFISHNLGNVLQLADDIVVLRDGAVVDAGPKGDATTDTLISRMVGRELRQVFPPRRSNPGPEVVLEARALTQPGIVKDVDLVLHKSEVFGLFGLMGSGRTELARILFGLDPCQAGEIFIHGVRCERAGTAARIRRGVAFVTEDRRGEGLLMEADVVDNVGLVALPEFAAGRFPRLLRRRQLRRSVGQVAESMRIKAGSLAGMLAKNLSGGNQQKVVIAKWLMKRPAVFIMDEPTRGIDVGAKSEVYGIIQDLAAEGAGVLLISSELEELTGMCDRIGVMSNGQVQAVFERDAFDPERILDAAFRGYRAHPHDPRRA